MEKINLQTPDLTDQNIDKIAELFPNCITETRDESGNLVKAVNFATLKQMLSHVVEEGDESYDFTWVGKKAAMVEAYKSINKTLRPCPEESVDWNNTKNLYIEGDNLEVLKLLLESYLKKVKMIYIDPPYNTGNDFIYKDNFHMTEKEWNEVSDKFDEEGNRLRRNTESNGRFHSDWCSMIYSRLLLARDLLSDNGIIFISIDDNEVDNLKKICNEVFGENNFVANFHWKKKGTTSNVQGAEVSSIVDSTLCYKRTSNAKITPRIKDKSLRTYNGRDEEGNYRLTIIEKKDSGSYKRDTMKFPIIGKYPRKGKRWQIGAEKAKELEKKNRFVFDGEKVLLKIYDFEDKDTTSAWPNVLDDCGSTDSAAQLVNVELFNHPELFDNPKPVELIKHFLNLASFQNSLILDFFSGSATTAHAVMQLNAEDGGNRQFIMVQIPEKCDIKSEAYKAGYKTICEIGKERIRRAGAKIKESMAQDDPLLSSLDTGFRVFKVADGNMNDVEFIPREYTQAALPSLVENIKPERTGLDLLFGCALDWGLSLSMPYSSEQVDGCTVHTYTEGDAIDLMACFDENVPKSVFKFIAKRKPRRVVFRDCSFKNSPSKINAETLIKTLSPDTEIKVI